MRSIILISVITMYFLCEAVSMFDTRIIQAKKNGFLHKDEAIVPTWTGLFGILGWLCFIVVAVLNWKIAIIVFVAKFFLKVIPVLENIGALIMLPVVGKETASAVNIVGREQKRSREEVKESLNNSKHKKPVEDIYRQAVKIVTQHNMASPALLQRELKIDYQLASRIIEKMALDKVIGPADGARPREVLVGNGKITK